MGYGQRAESALRLKGNISTQRRFPGSPRCRHRSIHSRAAPIQVGSTINGQAGTLNFDAHGPLINVFVFEIADGLIETIRSIINPDKLAHLGYPLSDVGRSDTRGT